MIVCFHPDDGPSASLRAAALLWMSNWGDHPPCPRDGDYQFTDNAGNHWARELEENYGSCLSLPSITGRSTRKTAIGGRRHAWMNKGASGVNDIWRTPKCDGG